MTVIRSHMLFHPIPDCKSTAEKKRGFVDFWMGGDDDDVGGGLVSIFQFVGKVKVK